MKNNDSYRMHNDKVTTSAPGLKTSRELPGLALGLCPALPRPSGRHPREGGHPWNWPVTGSYETLLKSPGTKTKHT